MRKFAFLATAMIAALGAASATAKQSDASAYTIWMAEENGYSTIAVSDDRNENTFSIAAGSGDLDVLTGEKATSAFKALKTSSSENYIEVHDLHGSHKSGRHRKIVIKSDSDGQQNSHSVRIMKFNSDGEDKDAEFDFEIDDIDLEGAGANEDAEIRIEDNKIIIITGGDKTTIVELPGEASHGPSGKSKTILKTRNGDNETSLIRISGVDAEDAAAFVDDMDGLERREKSAMKAALGL